MSLKQIIKKIKGLFTKRVGEWCIGISFVLLAIFNAYGTFVYINEIDESEIVIEKDAFSIKFGYLEGKTGNYVSSINGSKYYYITCSGVNRIKDENKVYFDTEDEAKDNGYEPSKNCKELAK